MEFTNQDNLEVKPNPPFFKRFLVQIIEAIIIIALLITVVIMGIKLSEKDNARKEEEPKDQDKEIQPTYPVTYKQISETSPAKAVLIHIPSIEVFMGLLHPAGSFVTYASSDIELADSFNQLKNFFYENNITVYTVKDALSKNKTKLIELAKNSLTYNASGDPPADDDPNKEKYEYYLSDEYKMEVLKQLSENQLVDIITTKPSYEIQYIGVLTLVYSSTKSFTPSSGLMFTRDQQITTAKGVVIGHLKSITRQLENDVLQAVFENLGSTPIGRVTEGYLDGGDFFVARKDMSILGVGVRTTIEGAEYLMKNDLVGTRYMAIVYDDKDQDDNRLQLDTVFNIVSDEWVVLLNFSSVPDKTDIERKVFLYDNTVQKSEIDTGVETIKNEYGSYRLIEKYDTFKGFLEKKNFKVIQVSHQQQLEFMVNFLNIGNNKILSNHKDLKDVIKNAGCNTVEVHHMNFGAIENLFGAAHGVTQVSRT